MGIKLITVKCPECEASLDIEEGRKQLFCSYCGSKILIQNDNEYIVHNINEADVRQAEADKIIRLRELELEERENKQIGKWHKTAYIIAGAVVAFGLLVKLIDPYNETGDMILVIGMLIAGWTFAYGTLLSADKKRRARVVSPNEVEINAQLRNCCEKNYNTILALYQANGFTNVNLIPLHDLNFFQGNKDGQVETVTINGNSNFSNGDIFLKTASVTITYHSMK